MRGLGLERKRKRPCRVESVLVIVGAVGDWMLAIVGVGDCW
jgi:hypothetical protein